MGAQIYKIKLYNISNWYFFNEWMHQNLALISVYLIYYKVNRQSEKIKRESEKEFTLKWKHF